MDSLPTAFNALRAYKQFIIYKKTETRSADGNVKLTKQPADYKTGRIKNAHDETSWTDADTAIEAAKRFGSTYGIGFDLTENDPFFLLDIDGCLDTQTNTWSPLACELIARFPGAAVEVSSSGKGLHIIGAGVVGEHSNRNKEEHIELYTDKRFIALTGYHARGDAGLDVSAQLNEVITRYFPKKTHGDSTIAAGWWSTEPVAEWNGPNDDAELLRLAMRSVGKKAMFNGGARFCDLWDNNEAVLALAYPAEASSNDPYNRSSADAALAQHLTFWTGNNAERMKNLMLQSGLVRDKWNREDYLRRTIESACRKNPHSFLNDTPLQVNTGTQTNQEPETEYTSEYVTGRTLVTVAEQRELFKGCTYIMKQNEILIPGGHMLDQQRFNIMFGGHSFIMDNENIARPSKNAWDAFTNGQALQHQKVTTGAFRPELKPGEIFVDDGHTKVNIYWPVKTQKSQGDVTLFLNHMQKLFPDPVDRDYVLYYMAALIQFKGTKFKWCPLIQGIEGNGKSFLSEVMLWAIGRPYSRFPKAPEITNKFNQWLYRAIFVGVEDIYTPSSKLETIEVLKPMITQEYQTIEPKGKDAFEVDICANFILNTNHKDGLRKTKNDRRIAVFYTPQQRLEDLKRDGMSSDTKYFSNLYGWARKNNGHAHINYHLSNLVIPSDFRDLLTERAPITSSNEEAITHGLGSVEQEVMEAIDQNHIGFRNGWVCSTLLDQLLEEQKFSRVIPQNKRADLMRSLGYDWHPALDKGRSTVMINGTKPRLYIKNGHVDTNLQTPGEVIKAYNMAQNVVDKL